MVSAKKLNDQFDELLAHLSIAPETLNWLETKLREAIKKHIGSKAKDEQKLNLLLKSIKQKIETTQERYLMQQDINPVTYQKVIAKLKSEQTVLERKIAGLGQPAAKYYQDLEKVMALTRDVKSAFRVLKLNQKHEFIDLVFGQSFFYQMRPSEHFTCIQCLKVTY